jgi:hypothetical protein
MNRGYANLPRRGRTREFRLFHYIEALEVLSGLVPGGGSLAVRIRAYPARKGPRL